MQDSWPGWLKVLVAVVVFVVGIVVWAQAQTKYHRRQQGKDVEPLSPRRTGGFIDAVGLILLGLLLLFGALKALK